VWVEVAVEKFLEESEEERVLDYSLLAESSKGQKIANFEKIKGIAAQFSRDGKGVSEFFQYLTNEIEFNKREEYAKIPSKSEVVIMTIHQAKGLQFPVVIIPDISHKPKSSLSEPFLIERIEGKMELGVSLYDNFNQGKRTVALNRIKSQIDTQESAERKRLFYVACTRAQSILCFVCQTNGKIKKKNIMDYSAKTWYEYLIDIFDIENLDFPENSQNSPLKIPSSVIDKNNLPVSIKTYNIEKKLEKKAISNIKKINYKPPEDKFLQFPKINRFSVTDIVNAVAAAGAGAAAGSTRSTIDSAKFGTAFHYLLQLGILEINPENEDKIKNYLSYSLQIENPEIYITELNLYLQNIRNSELYNIFNQKNEYTILPEFEVRYTNETKNGIYWELSAKIDLLYQDNQGKWHLIDYKTNKGNSPEAITKFHRYDIQIQFYLYLLKKKFGIKILSARIYYSYFNKFLKIEPVEDKVLENLIEKYIDSLALPLTDLPKVKESFQIKKETLCLFTLRPNFIGTTENGCDSVADSYSDKNLVILTPNRSIAKEINNSLQNPFIKAFRMQDYLTNLAQTSLPNIIDNKTKHLVLKHILGKDANISIQHFTGLIDVLEQAIELFYQNCKNSSKAIRLFHNLYTSYQNYLHKHNLTDTYYVYNSLLTQSELVAKTDFLLIGEFYFNDFPIWRRMLNFIKNNAKSFSVMPISKNSPAKVSCNNCLNLQDEVRQAAAKTFELLNSGVPSNEIKIILTDYEKYFPIVEDIFPQYGIKYNSTKGRKVKSSPVYALFDIIFRLLLEPYKFENIYAFFSNSFVVTDLNISLIDSFVRTNNLSNLEEFIKHPDTLKLETGNWKLGEQKPSFKRLSELLNKSFIISATKKKEPSYFLEKIRDILNKYRIQNTEYRILNTENSKAYKVILETLESLTKGYQKLGNGKVSLQGFYNDFHDWCDIVEFKIGEEYIGVEILGCWESISHRARYGVVLGMAEEIFPGSTRANFFVPDLDVQKRKLKQSLFIHWQKNYEELFFLFPEKDDEGNQLQKSSFIKDIPEKEFVRTEKTISRKEYFQDLIRNEERIVFQNNKVLEKLSKRNIEVKENSISKFEGRIDGSDLNIDHYNASDINLLARCPMRYLFQNILSLTELKRIGVEFERRDWGIFVHKVLESFGKDGGFNKNLQQAFTLMKQKANEQIDAFHYDMNNMFIRKEYEKYVAGLDDNSQNGILRNFLETNFKAFPGFRPINFEKTFGIDDDNFLIIDRNGKKIYISGRIDRIDKFRDNKSPAGDKYIVYDYKTGRENTFKLIRENIEFQ
ncbi:MAG: PD-(D/E)XK nuclease family protein, partial [Candidatus Cloacimonetes bacterium]|nr:PD-(D/E)XK nuclease family protein [Candidatus Cloacimonadota bacterium]